MRILQLHPRTITQLAFSPDGEWLASSGNDGNVILVPSSGNGESTALGGTREEWETTRVTFAFSPDTRWLVTSTPGHGIQVWDVLSAQPHVQLPSSGGSIVFVPCRNWLIANQSGTCQLDRWTIADWQPVPSINYERRVPSAISCDPLVPRVLGDHGELFDPGTGELIRSLWQDEWCYFGSTVMPWSPRGTMVGVGYRNKLRVFDPQGKKEFVEIKLTTKHFQDAAFTPDDRFLITVSNEASAKVWDTTTWQVVKEFAWKIGQLKCVAVSPDGALCAAGGDRGKAVIWDLD